MEYYTGTTMQDLQVAFGYALALGLGTGFTLALIRFLLFSFLEGNTN